MEAHGKMLEDWLVFKYVHCGSSGIWQPGGIKHPYWLAFLFFLQDMVNTYVINNIDLHKLRNDKAKTFFDLKDCSSPECVMALEQNVEWVLNLVATLSGADPWPGRKYFKAW